MNIMEKFEISDIEHEDVVKMVDVLLCISLVDKYFIDFKNIIERTPMYSGSVKNDFKRYENKIIKQTNKAYKVFNIRNTNTAFGYIFSADVIEEAISEHVLLNGIEKCVTILKSLFAIIRDRINSVTDPERTCNFDNICLVEDFVDKLFKFDENKAIRFIIEGCLKKRPLEITR